MGVGPQRQRGGGHIICAFAVPSALLSGGINPGEGGASVNGSGWCLMLRWRAAVSSQWWGGWRWSGGSVMVVREEGLQEQLQVCVHMCGGGDVP